MAKFRKKPVVVEAVQITDSTFDAPHPNPEHLIGVLYSPQLRMAFLETGNYNIRADLGDWIITDAEGKHHICTPDIFEATYEPVT